MPWLFELYVVPPPVWGLPTVQAPEELELELELELEVDPELEALVVLLLEVLVVPLLEVLVVPLLEVLVVPLLEVLVVLLLEVLVVLAPPVPPVAAVVPPPSPVDPGAPPSPPVPPRAASPAHAPSTSAVASAGREQKAARPVDRTRRTRARFTALMTDVSLYVCFRAVVTRGERSGSTISSEGSKSCAVTVPSNCSSGPCRGTARRRRRAARGTFG